MVNKGSLTFVCMFLIFGICDCQKKKDPVQGILTKTSKAINITNTKFKDVIKGTINAPLKPLDWTGVKLEESVVSSTKVIGKFSNAAGKKIKKLGKYLQKKETKFLNCIKQEQFDPVKAIIVDFSTCITSKTDSVNKIIQNSLKQLNNTSTIFKKIVLIPKCESAKCYADYSSGK
ncbi:hypothetical protein HHI36_012921 [Cryptolaemus montrouzieri]|uniref:Lipoprotein n=1 Tax=Cryptolaemus montrouzieri TaxID=559131 RepID=A0ABD2NFM7_9CUCU